MCKKKKSREILKEKIIEKTKKMIDIKPSPDYLNRTSGGSFSNFSMLFAGKITFLSVFYDSFTTLRVKRNIQEN